MVKLNTVYGWKSRPECWSVCKCEKCVYSIGFSLIVEVIHSLVVNEMAEYELDVYLFRPYIARQNHSIIIVQLIVSHSVSVNLLC